jgi:hypothetical protein
VTCLARAANATPPPTAEEQAGVIAATRAAALSFSDHLPDFICTQVTRRWVDQHRGSTNLMLAGPRNRLPGSALHVDEGDNWKLRDTLTIQLTYFGQKEEYKLLLVNGRKTKESYESVGGTTTYGDFGSILGILFQTSSAAAFAWDHWASINNQPVMVFLFEVKADHSQWHIGYGNQEVVTAFKGLVFIEPTEHQVLKLRVDAIEIPKKFPIQKSGVELDYRTLTVGEQPFLLPLKAVDWNDTNNLSTKNEAEFRNYRKFFADSKIDFDTPAPLPDTQIKASVPDHE